MARGDKFIKKTGFTFAEILFVITIIGVIASLTIPDLIISANKKMYENSLKKAYNTLTNAYGLLKADGVEMTDAFPGGNDGSGALDKIAPKLKIIKNCGSAEGCLYHAPLKYLNVNGFNYNDYEADNVGHYGKAILADGSMIIIFLYDSLCRSNIGVPDGPLMAVCASIEIDTNGAKGPNTVGRDVFDFWAAKTGIYSMGSPYEGGFYAPYGCDPAGDPDDDANGYPGTGWGCAYKVLTQGMNY